MTTLANKLREQPGIDVKRLKPGTHLFVETENCIYEMKVIRADLGLLEISSSDPPLRLPTVGQHLGGRLPPACEVEGWIGKGLLMSFRFRNGLYTSAPVISAEVKGHNWHYAVF